MCLVQHRIPAIVSPRAEHANIVVFQMCNARSGTAESVMKKCVLHSNMMSSDASKTLPYR